MVRLEISAKMLSKFESTSEKQRKEDEKKSRGHVTAKASKADDQEAGYAAMHGKCGHALVDPSLTTSLVDQATTIIRTIFANRSPSHTAGMCPGLSSAADAPCTLDTVTAMFHCVIVSMRECAE